MIKNIKSSKKDNSYLRDSCRLCGSKSLIKSIKMPACPPVDSFKNYEKNDYPRKKYPMDLFLCKNCGHSQLLFIVDPDILFVDYIYTSSSSPDLQVHFEKYASKLKNLRSELKFRNCLDIGCNDGLFLDELGKFIDNTIGVDPSIDPSKIAKNKGHQVYNSYFSEIVASKIKQKYGFIDLITANNVYSHMDDIRKFSKLVKDLLSQEGIFVFEVSYLLNMIENNVIDWIYHEHISHHSIKPLYNFLKDIGLELFKVEMINTKGGSIRCYAKHLNKNHKINNEIKNLIEIENKFGLYEIETYDKFQSKIENELKKSREYLDNLNKNNFKIAAFGASATATVIHSILDLDNVFTCIIDDNKSRQGLFSPLKKLEITSFEKALDYKITHIFISSWRHSETIIKKHINLIKRNKIKVIVPLPSFKILTL